jgi:NAD(P)-dependent dehydrogenase (short-subunit alcohol dehydrogenase family)
MKDLNDRVAFVTGAASGIGFGIAKSFARAGARLMLADIEEKPLQAAIEEIGKTNAAVDGVLIDVGDRDAVFGAAEKTAKRFGKVHVVCNNAGIGAGGPVEAWTVNSWAWTVSVNLMGVVHGIEAFVPQIKKHGEGGHIVNTASLAGVIGFPNMGAYSATKFAVVGLSETLRRDLEPFNIGVSVLCPGLVSTRIHDTGRTRPTRYGGPVTREGAAKEAARMAREQGASEKDAAAVEEIARQRQDMLRDLLGSGLDPVIVGERVREGIAANDAYIFTHPEYAGQVEERYAVIRQCFEHAKQSPALKAANKRPDQDLVQAFNQMGPAPTGDRK